MTAFQVPNLSSLWQQMLDALPDLVAVFDTDHRLIWLNSALAERLGVSRSKAVGPGLQLLPPGTGSPFPCHPRLRMPERPSPVIEGTIRGVDGLFSISASPLVGADGQVMGSIQVAREITSQRHAEEELRHERDFTAAILEIMEALLIVLDPEGRIVRFNRACERLTGLSAREAQGHPIWDFLIRPEERQEVRRVFALLARKGLPGRHENHWRTKEGGWRLISWSTSALRRPDGSVEFVIATGIDITERRQAEERMRQLAHYDVLTELPNRKLFADRLQQALARARRFQTMVAVLFLDLDHFKPVNDLYGHATGDLLLKQVAQRIRESVRETDTVGRIGGDEFVAAIEGLKERGDVEPVARKIIGALSEPFTVDGIACSIGVSIGITFYPTDGEDLETLVRMADHAMYEAKKAGGNCFRLKASPEG